MCQSGHAIRKDGTLLPHGYRVENGRRVGPCDGSNKPHGLAPSERAFLESKTGKSLGSYAADDIEIHLSNMTGGTCSVCGLVFPLDEDRKPMWHEYPDAPAYCLNHPRIHENDHCLGVHFPPLELSPEGAKDSLNTLTVLLAELEGELEAWRCEGLEKVFSETLRRYLTANDEGYERALYGLLQKREGELQLVKRSIESYRSLVENWELGCCGV